MKLRIAPAPLLLLALGLSAAALPAQRKDGRLDAGQRKADLSDALFGKGEVPRIRIEIKPEEIAKLKENGREYVEATLKENEKNVYEGVGVKLKGAAGSYREIDDRPAFTVDFDKFGGEKLFRDLKKIHLNNAVQDDSYCHDLLGSDVYLAAKYPAVRVTHARVWLNDRDLGLYVLKEPFDTRFLARHFVKTNGSLFDGGFCQEIDGELEKLSGPKKNDRSELKALLDACREPDPATRWKKIEERLDVDGFLTFMTLELMLGHWDGYAMNRNNYRIYVEPTTKKAWFMPHGMDQLFGDPDASVLDYPAATVAETVLRNPDWRAKYRKRINDLLPLFNAKEKLVPRIEVVKEKLEPILKAMDAGAPGQHAGAVRGLKDRLVAREKSLREQAKEPEPKALKFDPKGVAKLQGFSPTTEAGKPKLEQTTDGKTRVLAIAGDDSEPTVASWRKKVTLAKGKYAFEAKTTLKDFEKLAEERPSGVVLRLVGLSEPAPLADAADFKPLVCEFEILEDTRLVELVAEFRGAKGRAAFDLASMRLVKRP
jgi:spore coat protein H